VSAYPQRDQLDPTGQSYAEFAEFEGQTLLNVLAFSVQDAFWQLLIEGVVAPGLNSHNPRLPFFHVTEYGRTVLSAGPGHPHDPDGYIERLCRKVSAPDPTVMSYLAESLGTFRRGNLVASTVMLGIAAERVFLLLCESVRNATSDPGERKQFEDILNRFPMKPKLDWIVVKFQGGAVRALSGFPNNAHVATLAIYDLLRVQRNGLGHPQAAPPSINRDDAFTNLQVFPRFYEVVESIRSILSNSAI
jgi:hypothetical protein